MSQMTMRQWTSTEDAKAKVLSEGPRLASEPVVEKGPQAIYVDPSFTYQSLYGIGSSIEESTVFNLQKMKPANRDKIMESLFSVEKGMGWNLVRICFGSSDFTGRPYYSYDDTIGNVDDKEMKSFSIEKDRDFQIIATVKQALALNPSIKFFVSVWSAPAWMKTNKALGGGSLRDDCLDAFALYMRMAVEAWAKEGVKIEAVTLQNEPHMEHVTYPTCWMDWKQQQELLFKVKAEFKKVGLSTGVWILDHNFNMAFSYAGNILKDEKARSICDGVAFHDYGGDPQEMSTLHQAFPNVDIYFSERSVWKMEGMDRIIQYFRNWARCYCAWVTFLDDKSQPNSGCHGADPTFVMAKHDEPDKFWFIPEYYFMGHFTRFLKPGAVRVYSNYGNPGALTNIVFKNPEGEYVCVAVNRSDKEQEFSVIFDMKAQWRTSLSPRSLMTMVWKE